jgi:two-component system OmpR family response regulator
MANILFVEDDETIRENYSELLTAAGFRVNGFSDSVSALQHFESHSTDLAILDVALGEDVDAGFHLCAELRKRSEQLPIIFLSVRDSDIDKISGMRLGADDYLTKGASIHYLVARINALLHRIEVLTGAKAASGTILKRGNLTINMDTMYATWKDKPLDLSLTQLWMVHALASNRGYVRTPQQLMDAANITVQTNTLTVHMRNIRQIFESIDPDFSAIRTERGMGYRWVDEK